MRDGDQAEAALHGHAPLDAFEGARRKSAQAFTIVAEVPIAMFGCVRIEMWDDLTFGSIWMLGTDAVGDHIRCILRHARPWLDHITQGCHSSGGVVDCRQLAHIRWLRWLGYDVAQPVANAPFRDFFKIHV